MSPARTYMPPSDIWPLITKSKHHGSQADYWAPFEVVHSDVGGLFSMPTSTGNCVCILFIDDYTCYTILRVFPDEQLTAYTLAYNTNIRGKEKDSRYILAKLPLNTHDHPSKHIHDHTPLQNTPPNLQIHLLSTAFTMSTSTTKPPYLHLSEYTIKIRPHIAIANHITRERNAGRLYIKAPHTTIITQCTRPS